MTTIAHTGDSIDREIIEWTTTAKLKLGALITWFALGPLVGIWYANHVIIAEFGQPAVVPESPEASILSAYFSNVLNTCASGVVVWLVGIAILGVLCRRARTEA